MGPKKLSEAEKSDVIDLVARGMDKKSIAQKLGITPGQVAAVAAHLKMGSYNKTPGGSRAGATPAVVERLAAVQAPAVIVSSSPLVVGPTDGVFVGYHADTGAEIYWNPDADTGSANPHDVSPFSRPNLVAVPGSVEFVA